MKTIIEQSFDHVFLCDVVKINDKEEKVYKLKKL